MAGGSTGLKELGGSVIIIIAVAVASVMGIAVLQGFKDTNTVDNTTVDLFIAGIALVGSFIGIIMLAIIGKIVIGMFKNM